MYRSGCAASAACNAVVPALGAPMTKKSGRSGRPSGKSITSQRKIQVKKGGFQPILLKSVVVSNEAMVSPTFHLDVAVEHAPLALARLHRSLDVGAAVTIRVLPDNDRWEPGAMADVVAGAGFDLISISGRDIPGSDLRGPGVPGPDVPGPDVPGPDVPGPDVVARRARTLPDTVGPGMRVLVCGLNPSLVAADAGFGYAGPTNRFWRAVADAGLVTRPRDPFAAFEVDGVGMTDLVKRASPSASELARSEYVDGTARVRRLARRLGPGLVLFVGLAGWRSAVDRHAVPGLQPEPFGGVPAYVMPSTSGRNAGTSFAGLVDHVRSAMAS